MSYDTTIAALSDPTRRAIFEALRGEAKSVRELADTQPVSRPAVSQHLKILQDAGLLTVQPRGTRRLYAIRREGLEDLRDYLNGFWTDVLGAYGAHVEHRDDNH